jgi:SAM-dependent methyltransferase
MEGYEASTYGDRAAERYDELYADMDPAEAVEALVRLAGGRGPVLELAIGTGRIALPLAERGLEVHGVDASEAMVARLRAKPGGDRIPVTMGDFADVPVEGRFAVVFVAFNTFFALQSQEEQVRCFENVAAHLADDGVFALEAFVPDVARFDRGQRVGAIKVELDEVQFELSRYDPVDQRVTSQHVFLGPRGTELTPVVIRFAWPAELDLMARLAGLRLRERWGGWDGRPFKDQSERHVSVYGRG